MPAILGFLIGALFLLVFLYVVKLVLDQMELPPNVRQAALLIVGLIGLVLLLCMATGALPLWPWPHYPY